MGTQQYLHVMQLAHIVVVDGDQSHLSQTFTLHSVVYDITEAVEGLALCQFFLGFLYGGGDSEAEATTFIDFYLNHSHILFGNGLQDFLDWPSGKAERRTFYSVVFSRVVRCLNY